MTAIAWASLIVAITCVTLTVLVSVLCFRALSRVYLLIDTMNDRSVKQQDQVLDRFMAVDFASYKAYAMAESAGDGGMEIPESLRVPEEGTSGKDYGSISPLRLRFSGNGDQDIASQEETLFGDDLS